MVLCVVLKCLGKLLLTTSACWVRRRARLGAAFGREARARPRQAAGGARAGGRWSHAGVAKPGRGFVGASAPPPSSTASVGTLWHQRGMGSIRGACTGQLPAAATAGGGQRGSAREQLGAPIAGGWLGQGAWCRLCAHTHACGCACLRVGIAQGVSYLKRPGWAA